MSLPSCREIRHQLFVVMSVVMVVLLATTVLEKDRAIDNATEFASAAEVNWEDVNLSGQVNSPEDDVKTARSKMLGDFEAR